MDVFDGSFTTTWVEQWLFVGMFTTTNPTNPVVHYSDWEISVRNGAEMDAPVRVWGASACEVRLSGGETVYLVSCLWCIVISSLY